MELRVGQVLVETYRIERLIAEGGMGSVYEASHLRVTKRFAVKFLNVTLVDKTEALVRFRREAEIIASLDHPNVVGLFDYNITEDGVPYIVLEYLDGQHLGKRLEQGRIDLREAIRVVVPVVHALSAAHERGIVHRDLKPENIMLCRGEIVKVVDFGIAKICGHDLTALNSIIGTVPYMAPEQVSGSPVDGRADEFALASIVYEMLSGKMAFGGSQSVPEVAMRVMHHYPPPVPDVSDAVNAVIRKAMSKDREGRYPSMESFLAGFLEAASRAEEAPPEPAPSDEEGLPELAGEATMISQPPVAPADPIPAALHRTDESELPPLAEQATEIRRMPMVEDLPSVELAPDLAPQPTEISPPPKSLGPGVDLSKYKPLITAAIPTIEGPPESASPRGGPESTAVTSKVAPPGPSVEEPKAPEVRTFHVPASPRALAGGIVDAEAEERDQLLMTAEVRLGKAEVGATQLPEASTPPDGSPLPMDESVVEDTGKTSLPEEPKPELPPSTLPAMAAVPAEAEAPIRSPARPTGSMWSKLTMAWMAVATLAALVLVGFLLHHLLTR